MAPGACGYLEHQHLSIFFVPITTLVIVIVIVVLVSFPAGNGYWVTGDLSLGNEMPNVIRDASRWPEPFQVDILQNCLDM